MPVEVSEEHKGIRDEAGPHFWYVLEKIVNKIPDNPKSSDLRRAMRTMDNVANSYPCDECVANYEEYKKEHPLKCNSRAECAQYLCEFHNDIRRRQGREEKDCRPVEEGGECTSCKTKKVKQPEQDQDESDGPDNKTSPKNVPSNTPSPTEIAAIRSVGEDSGPGEIDTGEIDSGFHSSRPSIHKAQKVGKVSVTDGVSVRNSNSLDELKNVTRRIVKEYCEKEGLPVPQIVFSDCPSQRGNSCTRVPVDMFGKLTSEAPVKIYLDPNSYSPRTIIHELSHYVAKMKGDDQLFFDEKAIDGIARDVISTGFTESESGVTLNTVPPVQVAHDLLEDGHKLLADSFQERAQKRLNEWKRNFPTFSKLFAGPAKDEPAPATTVNTTPEPMVKAEPPPEIPQGTHYTDGFLTMIDPVFSPIAKVTGLHPRDVTESHIPNLLGNVMMTLAESNLNDFGSLLVGTLGAGLTLLIGVAAKDQLGMGDRKFLMGMGGNLMWNSLRYVVNPKINKDVFSHAQMFGKAVSTMDWNEMQYTMSYDAQVLKPGMNKPGDVKNLTPAQIRALQINQGFQPDVPVQNTYPVQGASTGGIGMPYGGHAIARNAPDHTPYGGHTGASPYGNLDSEFDEYSLEENNRIARAQRSQFNPAIA